jgi:hypothetical protein
MAHDSSVVNNSYMALTAKADKARGSKDGIGG